MRPAPDRDRTDPAARPPLARRGLLRARRWVWLAAFAAAGCEGWRSVKNDHPVLGPPPPRMSWNEAVPRGAVVADASDGSAAPGVVNVSLTGGKPIEDHTPVAVVNGETILAGEILAPYRGGIAAAKGKAADWQIEGMKRQTIKKDLDRRIEKVLLMQALRLTLKEEQLKKLDEQLDKAFGQEMKRLMTQVEASTKPELEAKLAEQGLTLEEFADGFKTQQMATLYVTSKASVGLPVFGRREVVGYYEDHPDEFTKKPRVRFQLLLVNYASNGGKDQARRKLLGAVGELTQGADFGEVCKKLSEGPRADRGGQWDWLRPGDFAEPAVEKDLFSLPVGGISGVHEGKSAFMVVKVTEREEGGPIPLGEVQDQIKDKLERESRQAAAERLVADLKKKAIIEIYPLD